MTGTLILRADASVEVGTGHVMRCLALAQAWQKAGGKCCFVIPPALPILHEHLRQEGMEVVAVDSSMNDEVSTAHVVEAARKHCGEWVVIDGPEVAAETPHRIRRNDLKVLQVDDSGIPADYFADVIVNQNPGATEGQYGKRQPRSRLLLGTQYVLLRREFTTVRTQRDFPEVARRLLVTLGGTDPDGLTLCILRCLDRIAIPGLEAIVAVGGSNPRLNEIQEAASACTSQVRVLVNCNNMADLMATCDMAVIAAGGTLWELLGSGCAVLSYARNQTQLKIIRDLEKVGAVRVLGDSAALDAGPLISNLREIALSRDLRMSMAEAGMRMVDGQGAARVVNVLCGKEALS